MTEIIKNISKKTLIKNILLNFFGYSIPFLVALITIPIIIRGLGTERLAVLTLIWAIINYFNLFDFGLSRALTYKLAKDLSRQGEEKESSILVWTVLSLLFILGIIGGGIGIFATPWLTKTVIRVPPFLQNETLNAFYLLFLSIPIIILTIGFRGVLQAYHRFDLINTLEIPIGVLTFLSPVFVLFFSKSLTIIVGTLIIIRLTACFVSIKLVFHIMPGFYQNFQIDKNKIKELFSLGGWMTVTNFVGPVLVYIDRFFLSVMGSLSTVAYYTTPYEAITKLWAIPAAISRVLFPTFSSTYNMDYEYTLKIFIEGTKYIFLSLYLLILIIFIFAYEFIQCWLGMDFALHSTRVLQWLTIGVLINSLTQVSINHIHGVGRPDLAAKLHLLELPVYLLGLWILIKSFGIEGAAMAWVGRVRVDAIILFSMSARLLHLPQIILIKTALLFLLSLFPLILSLGIRGFYTKLYFFLFFLILFIIITCKFILSPEEKKGIRNIIKKKHQI